MDGSATTFGGNVGQSYDKILIKLNIFLHSSVLLKCKLRLRNWVDRNNRGQIYQE